MYTIMKNITQITINLKAYIILIKFYKNKYILITIVVLAEIKSIDCAYNKRKP